MAPGPTNQPQYSNDNLLMNLRFVGQMVKTSTKKKWFDLSVFERSSLNIETLAEFNDMISFAFEKFNVEHYGHFLDMGFHLEAHGERLNPPTCWLQDGLIGTCTFPQASRHQRSAHW